MSQKCSPQRKWKCFAWQPATAFSRKRGAALFGITVMAAQLPPSGPMHSLPQRQGLLATDSSPLSPSSGIAFCQRIWFLLCGSPHPEIGQYGRQSPMPLASRALFRTSSGQLPHSSAYPFAQSGSLHPPAAAFPNALSNKPACKGQRLRVRFLETPTSNA